MQHKSDQMSNVEMLKSVKQSAEFNTATAKLPRPITTNGHNIKRCQKKKKYPKAYRKRRPEKNNIESSQKKQLDKNWGQRHQGVRPSLVPEGSLSGIASRKIYLGTSRAMRGRAIFHKRKIDKQKGENKRVPQQIQSSLPPRDEGPLFEQYIHVNVGSLATTQRP